MTGGLLRPVNLRGSLTTSQFVTAPKHLTKKYEQQYVEEHNRLFDELESACINRGIPATREDLDTIRENIANEMHEWLKSNSEKYGFYYTFIST